MQNVAPINTIFDYMKMVKSIQTKGLNLQK